ncbi:MAG TPA: AAA family ATPase [Deltaproteobacteria bacterium]|nr:AAA family ATPase [Deltaproteobacteria bacterium]
MFESFFGLSENPFNLTPDPKFLFLSQVHQEALSHLQYGIEQRKGFVLITGEVGAGKTTICRSLLAKLPRKTRTALVLNPSLSSVELLQTINQDFGIDAAPTSKKELLDRLYEFLIQVFVDGENAVLIIDECQNLSPDVLEQIRMLSNLETEKEKLLQILLIGQPQLAKMLSSPDLKQINDRIVLRYHIWPLGLADTKEYISHRLAVAGSHGNIKFTSSALKRIYASAQGLPRKINAVAERSLLIAYLKAKRTISKGIVDGAIQELRGNYHEERLSKRLLVPAIAVAFFIVFLGIFWPSLFSDLSEYIDSSVIATDRVIMDQPDRTQEEPTNTRDWVIPDYDSALETLALLPEGLTGPDTLNLHPQPECLKHIGKPSIASVETGYLILVHATDDFVRFLGRDKAIVEVGMDEFKSIYRWNIMINYAKEPEEKIYTFEDTGEEVEKIQYILSKRGYLPEEPSGIYDVATSRGVERLQEEFGLARDGVAGPETMTLIALLEKGMK